MKKPKHITLKHWNLTECKQLGVPLSTRVVILTEADFNRIWKLAKEAEHFNNATRTYGTSNFE